MKKYAVKGYQGNPEYMPYGMPEEDNDEFEINEEWHEEEFDENMSHASSRAGNTIVNQQRSTNVRNQVVRSNDIKRESEAQDSPIKKRSTNYNYKVVSDENLIEEGKAYEEGDYLVVGQEVIVEEENEPEVQRDFKSAYDKLVEKVHSEQGMNLLLNQYELEQAIKKKELRKQLKEHTDERIRKFNENKRRKMELIKQENEMKEMDNCTFKPQLVAQPINKRRNFDEFLESQRKHEEDKALKRNIMLEQESQVETGVIHHPEINDSSRRMLANRPDADLPVHERLYGISKNSKINQIVNQVELNTGLGSAPNANMRSPKNEKAQASLETYIPQINQRSKEIVRDQPVQELLYNDALRKRDMNELRKKQKQKQIESKLNILDFLYFWDQIFTS